MYLAGIKDLFTCEIVGYAMADRMTQQLTVKALFRTVQQKRPPFGLIHHSNRGSQYCAEKYRKLVEQFSMKASMSRRDNCYDNAQIESFWGTLKNEWFMTDATPPAQKRRLPSDSTWSFSTTDNGAIPVWAMNRLPCSHEIQH